MMSTLCPVDAFLPLPDCLGDDYSDLEDLLCVPQGSTDLGSLSCSSLDATDLFLPEFGLEHSVEATSSFSSPASDASSRLEHLTADFPLSLSSLDQQVQQAAVAAPLPLGMHGLKLKLDTGAVLCAWAAQGGGAHPFQLRGPALAAAAAALPSTADLAASLATAAQAGTAGPVPVGLQGEEVARRRPADVKKAPARRPSTSRVSYPARKVSADKRPRIKGRFVTRAEFEQMLTVDRAVPAHTAVMCA